VALLLTGLSVVLSLVAAVAAIVAALWARSASQALDGFAALTLPLLARVKQKVDPDPMIASVVAAAAAAPPPAIIEAAAELATGSAPLPVIVTDDEDERRESAPFVEPDEHSPTTERQRQLDARRKREAEEIARKVQPLSEEEAERPSGEGFAMDRPSWEGRTAVHDTVSLQAAVPSPPPLPVPIGRIVPRGAPRGGAPPARLPPPSAPPKPRAKADSSPTLTSEGIVPGPRRRFDPRVEPEAPVDVARPRPSDKA